MLLCGAQTYEASRTLLRTVSKLIGLAHSLNSLSHGKVTDTPEPTLVPPLVTTETRLTVNSEVAMRQELFVHAYTSSVETSGFSLKGRIRGCFVVAARVLQTCVQ